MYYKNMKFRETSETIERFTGAIFGALFGDAYAVSYEGRPNYGTYRIEENRMTRSLFPYFASDMLGGGEFNMPPGQISYHSEWALVLIQSIIDNEAYNTDDAAMAYCLWARSNPKGLPEHLKNILDVGDNCFHKKDFERRLKKNASRNTNRVDSCVLARQIGLALTYRLASEKQLMEISEKDTRLTHSHPMVIKAAKIFVVALRRLLLDNSITGTVYNAVQMSEKMCPLLNFYITMASSGYDVENVSEELLENAPIGYQELGFDLHVAFWAMFYHRHNAVNGVDRAVNRNYVKPTMHTSLAGAMIGAAHGMRPLSRKWYVCLTNAPIRNRRVKALNMLRHENGNRAFYRLRLLSVKFWHNRKLKRGETKDHIPDRFRLSFEFFDGRQKSTRTLKYRSEYGSSRKQKPKYQPDNDDYVTLIKYPREILPEETEKTS